MQAVTVAIQSDWWRVIINQTVTFTGGNGTNTTVTGSATNAPVPTPVLQVTPGSVAYGTILNGIKQDEQFHGSEHRNRDLDGYGKCGRPVQHCVRRKLHLEFQPKSDGDGDIQSNRGEQL
jgi:hypothetical protein